ncbi:MAG TPA: hypothetical protein VLQ79_12500 [Myxococcaceae bacterium]|nr:hypothetical protein [Myxococcaceae bacterium]
MSISEVPAARPVVTCSPLTAGDMGLKVLLCESPDGSQGEISFMPIVGWVTLTESPDATPETASWSWQPVVVFEHELRLARTVPNYRGTVAKDVIGKVATGLLKSRFITARDLRRSHSPIWSNNTTGM